MKALDKKIYLASKSPRRRELLRQINVDFELLLLRDRAPNGPDVDEAVKEGESASEYVARVAREKADYSFQIMQWRKLPLRPILAADTVVSIDDRILCKPADRAQAIAMLTSMSGRTHHVLTSIVVRHEQKTLQVTQRSDVMFAPLSEAVIRAYCSTSEPFDKAGAYGIQGLASLFVQHITGSYTGIMGLPLFETAQLLQQAGVHIL